MLQYVGSLASLALLAAAVAFIFGQPRLGKKLVVGAIVGAALVAFVEKCWPSGATSEWLIALVLLLFLAVIFRRFFFLFKALWWLTKGYVRTSYHVGVWLAERILLRFPIVLLPAVSRHMVVAASVVLTQTSLTLLAMLVLYFSEGRPLPTSASFYGWLGLPVVVILVFGNIGKWAYRREERRGLANV
ncbi:MAG: hypothetical protein C4523_00675 [Myxococcales bacterium]|nr:MAG: hypothetical protein C4523_00675 [Myxococcales bacterium]